MCTACRPGTASSSSSEWNGAGSNGWALARVRAGDDPTIPTTSTPMRRSASVCTSAIHPVPTIPARMVLMCQQYRFDNVAAGRTRCHVVREQPDEAESQRVAQSKREIERPNQ